MTLVITTCTNRKRKPISDSLRVSALPQAPIDVVACDWASRLSAASDVFHRLAIAGSHAVSHWTSRRHPSVSKLYKDVVADTNAYNLGKALIMHNGVRMWDVPPAGEKIAPVDPEFFRQLVKRLESRTA